jgi:hypothetical protein
MATLPERPAASRFRRAGARGACAIALLSFAPAVALAEEPAPEPPKPSGDAIVSITPAAPPKPTRRGGFVVGLTAGAGAASLVGYPNDEQKIGYASYYTVTGVRPAGLAQLWIGGAFSDWITFGVGFSGTPIFATGSNQARSSAGMFHIEAFPLFALGGRLRDLGIMLDAGFGTANVTDPTGTKLVDSSSTSLLGGGVFYEGIRTWKIAQGPFLMGNYMWSDTALRPGIFAGWRVSLYTKP